MRGIYLEILLVTFTTYIVYHALQGVGGEGGNTCLHVVAMEIAWTYMGSVGKHQFSCVEAGDLMVSVVKSRSRHFILTHDASLYPGIEIVKSAFEPSGPSGWSLSQFL